ncbi:hypothetical protein DCS_05515 [Drechmeria coniospora]|uniref:Histone deacetylation protein Rxt3 n=1 Tax=Drechmeria coniospora TaxID=98403 RepID=A0A151GN16_DRECN|nr:hypothetical protein DCS_05515 [Drechmeria coniospora]KYK58499.1 hypothetical protein DCS_05515 [Drechmeria coniospora]
MAASPAAMPPKPKTTVTSKAVLDAVANRPRHHLGDFIYEAGLQPGRLLPTNPTQRGFASTPKPLPSEVIDGKENCTLTVKVPRVHLSSVAREEITSRAFLWGTDVYTDDSDVVAACIHAGWIKGEWADDVDGSMLDLDDGDRRKGRKQEQEDAAGADSEGLITSPPASGPLSIPPDRDLHVNILILPKLYSYAAMTRHGISSREFGGRFGDRQASHDGISYMIRSIRWVENGGQPQARLRGKARRERMRKAMREVTTSFGNMHGLEPSRQADGAKDRTRALVGEISPNWRQEETEQAADKTEGSGGREPSEGDKENRLRHPAHGDGPSDGKEGEAKEGEAAHGAAEKAADKDE